MMTRAFFELEPFNFFSSVQCCSVLPLFYSLFPSHPLSLPRLTGCIIHMLPSSVPSLMPLVSIRLSNIYHTQRQKTYRHSETENNSNSLNWICCFSVIYRFMTAGQKCILLLFFISFVFLCVWREMHLVMAQSHFKEMKGMAKAAV